jgi:uncharacterized protein (DUF1015 family)
VLTAREAAEICRVNPHSFLHVTRPDVHLSPGDDPHRPEGYLAARSAYRRMFSEGALVTEPLPCLYLYSLRLPLPEGGFHEQSGFVGCFSIDEHLEGLIRRHEHTRPEKVEDRYRLIEALDAQTGMIFLAWRDHPELAALLSPHAARPPLWSVQTEDGVTHTLGLISDLGDIQEIQRAFTPLRALYVADGHHRLEAATWMAARRTGPGEHRWFLAGAFPEGSLLVRAYHRLVRDLNGLSTAEFLVAVSTRFTVTEAPAPEPGRSGLLHMFLDGRWWSLLLRPGLLQDDPVARLDVSVLQDHLLAPILAIHDPRQDRRIEFIGSPRGPEALEEPVRRGEAAVAFALHPPGLDPFFDVADMGRVMPPKPTWFQPKLRGGVLVHRLTEPHG